MHQNYRHIKAIEEITGIAEDNIFSIVMFIGESTFKTKMPSNVLDRGLTTYIKSKTDIELSTFEVSDAIKKINDMSYEKTYKTNRQHVRNLRKSHAKTNATCPRCSRCSSDLVKRVARRGANKGNEFYGCVRFPKCKFTKNIV